jgi:hypothetical protein
MPLTAYHPHDPITNQPLAADAPGVEERQHIGVAKNSVYKGKLKHEFWLDEAKVKQVNKDIYAAAMNGEPMDVSTGLQMQYRDAPPGSHINGIAYSWVGHSYKPDHIAILPTQKGACSVEAGCGMNMNMSGLVINSFIRPPSVSPLEGKVGDSLFQNFDLPLSQFVDNVWTDQARTAAALTKHAYAQAHKAQEKHMSQQAGAAATGQGGKGGGGKSQAYAPGQASEAAYQASMQAHQRGIASMQDLAHVEYAHQIAAYQAELAAAAHHHAGDKETAEAHRKAGDAHRKTSEQLRKKIDDTPAEGAGKKGKAKKKGQSGKPKKKGTAMPVRNELPFSEIHSRLQKECDECHKAKGGDLYDGPMVHSVYDKHFIYQKKGKWHQQAYKVTKNDKVKLKDEPFEVERKVTYHPVTNASTEEFTPIGIVIASGNVTLGNPNPATAVGVSMAAVNNAAAWRQATIQFLITNAACGCMKDKVNTLNELTDKKLNKLAKKVLNEFAQGSFAGASGDTSGMERQMSQIDRITSGKSAVPDTKSHTTQSTDNHPTHLNAAEWLASAPPEIREIVQLSLNSAADKKVEIVNRLTAGVPEAQREAAKAVFNKMSMPDLIALNSTIPVPQQLPPGFEILRGMGHFAGAGAPIANRGGSQQNDANPDILPLPTHNAYDAEEREKAQWLKAKREAETAARSAVRA